MNEQTAAPIVAFKGFDQDLKCRGFQFEVGKTYKHNGPVKACESGFHSCENPLDVWGYYDVLESRFCEVELSGEIARHGEDSKIASAEITIKAELKLPEFIRRAVERVIELCKTEGKGELFDAGKDSARIGSSGDSARIGSSGRSAKIKAEGEHAVVACAGSVAYVQAGKNGAVCIPWYDGKRTRFAVGYVGENLKADTKYTVNDKGEFEEVKEAA